MKRKAPSPRALLKMYPSQSALAAALDVRKQTVSAWITRNLREVPVRHHIKIAHLHPEDYGYLLT